jgi:hypothetical protein
VQPTLNGLVAEAGPIRAFRPEEQDMTELSDLPEQGGHALPESGQDLQQNRDEGGRFTEGQRQPEGQGDQPQGGAQGGPQGAPEGAEPQRQEMVPHQALHAAREEAKGYRERFSALENRYNEDRNAMLALQRQNMELMTMIRGQMPQAAPQPQAPQEPPPDWFTDPNAAAQHFLKQGLTPFQEEFKQTREKDREAFEQARQETFTTHVNLSKEIAAIRFGDDVVQQAEQWLDSTVQANPAMKPVLQSMIFGPGKLPGVEMVKLYQGQTPLGRPQSVDPLVEAEVNRRLAAMGHAPAPQSQAAPQPQAQPAAAPALPSSFATARHGGPRSSPQATGPRPLSDIMGR